MLAFLTGLWPSVSFVFLESMINSIEITANHSDWKPFQGPLFLGLINVLTWTAQAKMNVVL